VDKGHVIEILDMNGHLAVAITQSSTGSVTVLTPGDPQFAAHANVTKQRVSKVHIHTPEPAKHAP